jgi:GTPase involved in cell partitioning and DNA repair
MNTYTINEETARRAHEAVHMSNYKENSATNEYQASVEEVQRIGEEQKKKVSPFYHDKIDALVDKYARRLAKWYNDYNRNEASCPSWFITGPANYPMRKHERQMNRERTLWAEYDEIKAIIDRIKAVGKGGIDLADPNAREMLEERLAELKSTLERSKEINKYYRKNKTMIGFPEMEPEKAEKMTQTIKETMERCPWITNPIPAYELTSLRDKIKRTESKLEELNRRQEAQTEEEQHEGYQIIKNVEIDRLQILFDEIPDEETRSALKSNGFRWSPRNKAWQRQLTANAERAAKIALKID